MPVLNLLFFFYPTSHYFEVSFTTLTDNAILIFLASSFSLITCSGLAPLGTKTVKDSDSWCTGFYYQYKNSPCLENYVSLHTQKKPVVSD